MCVQNWDGLVIFPSHFQLDHCATLWLEHFAIVGSVSTSEFPLHRIIAVVIINLVGIVIQPHFSQAWWFRLVLIGLGLLILFLIFRYRDQRIKKREAQKRSIQTELNPLIDDLELNPTVLLTVLFIIGTIRVRIRIDRSGFPIALGFHSIEVDSLIM